MGHDPPTILDRISKQNKAPITKLDNSNPAGKHIIVSITITITNIVIKQPNM